MKKSLEEEQSKLKQGKVDFLQKLKKELKAKETESMQKDTELQVDVWNQFILFFFLVFTSCCYKLHKLN